MGGAPSNILLNDLDGDGDLDVTLLSYSYPNSTISVRLNNGTGSFGAGSDVVLGQGVGLVVGDMDKDGDLDLCAAWYTTFGLATTVLKNDGRGNFPTPASFPNFGAVTAAELVLGDVNGDGNLDFAAVNENQRIVQLTGSVSVRLNQGAARRLPLQRRRRRAEYCARPVCGRPVLRSR